jgi:hypothetical protein
MHYLGIACNSEHDLTMYEHACPWCWYSSHKCISLTYYLLPPPTLTSLLYCFVGTWLHALSLSCTHFAYVSFGVMETCSGLRVS